jgi:uncharacterized protein (TIGR03435 family)
MVVERAAQHIVEAHRVFGQLSKLARRAPRGLFPGDFGGGKGVAQSLRRICVSLLAATGLTAGLCLAGGPAFDAASVKVVDPEQLTAPWAGQTSGGPGTSDPGRFDDPFDTMSGLLAKAFNVDELQIAGPAWVTQPGSFYAVTATIPRGTTQVEFLAMFQNLLAERFHLVAHHETRKFPGYELVVVNDHGPKFKEALSASGGVGGPPPNGSGAVTLRAGQIQLTEQPMSVFVKQLERRLRWELDSDRTPWVVDQTGLTGKYTFTLQYASRMGSPVGLPGVGGAEPNPSQSMQAAKDPSNRLDLFEAIQKELGLKLNRIKDVPVDMLVVDKLDKKPVAN